MTVGAKNLKPVGCAPTSVPPILRFVVFLANAVVLFGRRRRVPRLLASEFWWGSRVSLFLSCADFCVLFNGRTFVQTRQQQQQGVNFIGPSGTVVYTNSSSFGAPNCVERDRQTETETTDRRTDIDRELYNSQAHVWWDAVTRGGCEY